MSSWTCRDCGREFDEAWRYNLHRDAHLFMTEPEEDPNE